MSANASELFRALIASGKHFKIKLLGDSITHGVGGSGFCQNGEPIVEGFARNPNGYCWAKQFKQYMEGKYDCEVLNNACTGTTIEFVISNFDRLVDEDDDVIICTIGTNNRHQLFTAGPKKSREEMLSNFSKSIERLNEKFLLSGKKYVLIANIPASAQNERDTDAFWRILHMNDINDAYKSAHASLGFTFVSMYDLFSDYCAKSGIEPASLLIDGLHPSDQGYDVMFALIKSALSV
jgi:lysophospholipase L1-like esterase